MINNNYLRILQACKNPEIFLVEYAYTVNLSPSKTVKPTPEMFQPSKPLPNEAKNSDICQHIDSLQEKIDTYTVLLNSPRTVEVRRKQCSKLIKKLNNKSNNSFYAVTYPEQSCQSNGNDVKLMAKLNLKALKYVSLYNIRD